MNQLTKSLTLVEVLVSISILAIGMVAVLTLSGRAIMFGGLSKQRLIATNLAREGIEIVRAIRDSNRLDPFKIWPYGLENGDWLVNYNTTSLSTNTDNSSISLCNNCQLCLSAGLYQHLSPCALPTEFKRMVSISDSNNHKEITSKVYWKERGQAHSLIFKEILTEWR